MEAAGRDAGAGNRAVSLVLRNTGGTTCTLYGYPEVVLLDSIGAPLPGLDIRKSEGTYFQAPKAPAVVTLPPGASAYVQLAFTAMSVDEAPCPTGMFIVVVPSGSTDSLRVAQAVSPCNGYLRVTPIRARAPQ